MAKEKPAEQTKVWLLPIEKITPSPFQARTVFDEGEIKKLAVSILQNGLLQPISVRPTVDGRYQLIAGERRLRACKLTGMETIPAIIYHFEDEKTAALSLLENLQREQLGPFEQARALRDLLNLWNCTQEAGARRLGIAQPTLANKLRLLTLTQEQQDICTEANLTERHARAVLRLPTSELRTKALRTAAERGYNVQQTEALVERVLSHKSKPKRSVMVRDVRIFVNTIDRAVKMMTGSGIPATAEKREQADYIEYVVRIPTHRPVNRIFLRLSRPSYRTRASHSRAPVNFVKFVYGPLKLRSPSSPSKRRADVPRGTSARRFYMDYSIWINYFAGKGKCICSTWNILRKGLLKPFKLCYTKTQRCEQKKLRLKS